MVLLVLLGPLSIPIPQRVWRSAEARPCLLVLAVLVELVLLMDGILCICKVAYKWDIPKASAACAKRSGEMFHIGAIEASGDAI